MFNRTSATPPQRQRIYKRGAAPKEKGTTMKKAFKLDEIDCANCARELQDELAKLEGVQSVSVNFMTQKLTLEAADDEFDAVLERVVDYTAEAEPDCEIIR